MVSSPRRRRMMFFFFLFASVSLAQTPVTFAQPANIGMCSSLVTADFNGDGNLDVACSYITVTIWLGDGHGHFRESPQQLPFQGPMVAGDFNGDGRADLIVTNNNVTNFNGQIAFFPGNGNGTFGAPVTISTLAVAALATIRLNPNGPLDLIVADQNAGAPPYPVEVFPGNGDGTFQNPITTPINSGVNIVVADFNGDGVPDIASIGQPYGGQPLLQVVLGNSDGSFGPLISTTVATVQPFAAADFNGDGIMDVAWTYQSSIYVYTGNGGGTFSPGPVTRMAVGVVVLATDLNGDGKPDLVMDGIAIALNSGGGEFAPSQWYQNLSGSSGVAGDFRNLGVQDLIVAGDYYENAGKGTFKAPRSYPAGCEQCAYLATGDFNGDGKLDVAVAEQQQVRVLLGNGAGGFPTQRVTNIVLPSTHGISALVAADFNNDAKLDVAIATQGVGTPADVAILPGNGDGTFGAPIVAYTGNEVYALAAADFNGSGYLGLAIATKSSVIVLCGTAGPGYTMTATLTGIANTTSVVVADFNRDGIPDIATASDIYLGNGDGTFHHAYRLAQSGTQVGTADFNGDGILDLLTFSSGAGAIVYWPGIGDGTFGLPLTVATASGAFTAIADLNGDGIPDIVTDTYYAYTMTLYLGKGDGNFVTEAINNLPQFNQSPMVAGTFSTNGKQDLVMVSLAGQVCLLTNTTK